MKSRNKIFPVFFLMIFLISNTGIPLSLHLCQMMKSVTTDECDMCSFKETGNSSDSGIQQITSEHSGCCEKKIAAEPLKDRFVSVKEEINNDVISIPAAVISEIPEPDSYTPNVEFNGSPPVKTEQPLYLLISSLLI